MTKSEIEEHSLHPSDIIFSCSVCQATLSDIYKTAESSKGLRDGRSPEERIVPKLWLADCCHVFCAKHLESGGVPFTPRGERPRAPCPVCVEEKNQKEPRTLYDIRGVKENECDPIIPRNWFDIPPIQLDGKEPEIQALRFQYLALVRYASRTSTSLKTSQQNNEDLQSKLAKEAVIHRNMEDTIEDLKAKLTGFEQCERELKNWKSKEKVIKHYLSILTEIATENQQLKQQLVSLGYAVPNKSYVFRDDVHDGVQEQIQQDERQDKTMRMPNSDPMTSSSRTLSGPYLDHHSRTVLDEIQPLATQSDRKRKASGSPEIIMGVQVRTHQVRGESRDLMPPPALPIGRHSERRVQNFTTSSPNALKPRRQNYAGNETRGPPPIPDISIYDGGSWQSADRHEHGNGASHASVIDQRDDSVLQSLYQARERSTPGSYPLVQDPVLQGENINHALRSPRRVNGLYRSPDRSLSRGGGPVQFGASSNRHSEALPRELMPPEQFPSSKRTRYRDLADAQGARNDVTGSPPFKQRFSAPSSQSAPLFAYNHVSVPESSDARVPLQPASASTVNRQRLSFPMSNDHPNTSQASQGQTVNTLYHHPSTPSPTRRNMGSRAQFHESVASPFFKAGSQKLVNTNKTRHPPSGPLSRPAPVQSFEHSYRMASAPTYPRNQSRAVESAVGTDPGLLSHQPRLQQQDNRTYRFEPPALMVPSTPRDSQGLFVRPDLPRDTYYHQQQVQRQPPMTGSVIGQDGPSPIPSAHPYSVYDPYPYSLQQPSSRQTPIRDDALNVVRGVKSGTGGGFQPSNTRYYNAFGRHGYEAGGNISSAAGARRVARR